jgi:hypothetical protein
MNTQDDDDRALRDQAKDWVLQLTTGAATQHDLRALGLPASRKPIRCLRGTGDRLAAARFSAGRLRPRWR